MAKHAKTQNLIEAAREILSETNPMTVRQVYYQLVSRQVIKNDRAQYQAVSNALVGARKDGSIPWAWIEDRLRRPREVAMWGGLADFADTVQSAYRRDTWATQPAYLECWCEKDALSGIFEDILEPYGVTLNVGRGYDGWSSIYNSALRYQAMDRPVTILYFGDFDPSGEDMAHSLVKRLGELDCWPEIIKCALTKEDIDRYRLPPDFAKKSDTRAAAFIEKHGDISVELDALPMAALRERIEDAIRARMDLDALERIQETEERERERLIELIGGLN